MNAVTTPQLTPSSAPDCATLQQFVQEVPDACERLVYVRKMTEQAAMRVFDLVEPSRDSAERVNRQGLDLSEMLQRQALSQELTLERARSMLKLCASYAAKAAAFAAREKEMHAEIMQAQDFQDLSGQVINKVVRLLDSAQAPLQQMLGELPAVAAPLAAGDDLAGVQTPDKALKQDDVDDLLASLGF